MIKKYVLLIAGSLFLSACTLNYGQPGSTQTQAPVVSPTETQIPAQAPVNSVITISNFSFSPDPVTATKGQVITITNKDSVPHTVTSDDGTSFNVGPIDPGASASFTTPSTKGSYAFHCNIHKSMTDTLVVQ